LRPCPLPNPPPQAGDGIPSSCGGRETLLPPLAGEGWDGGEEAPTRLNQNRSKREANLGFKKEVVRIEAHLDSGYA